MTLFGWEVFSQLPSNRLLETGVDCVALATVVTQQTMRAGKQCRDCGLQVLIEHLHIFSLVKLFEFDLPPQVDVGPPRVDLEETVLSHWYPSMQTRRSCWEKNNNNNKGTFSPLNMS